MPRGCAEQQDSLAAEGLQEAVLLLPGWSRWNGFLERGNHLRGTFCLMFQLKEELKNGFLHAGAGTKCYQQWNKTACIPSPP